MKKDVLPKQVPRADGAYHFPRRSCLDQHTPAEKAIYDAHQAVEKVGAHRLLTEAVVLLSEAQGKVADYLELEDKNHLQEPDPIVRVDQLLNLVGRVVNYKTDRIGKCSVATVMYRPNEEGSHVYELEYSISLHCGPFITPSDTKVFTKTSRLPLTRKDALQFVAGALSAPNSPYCYNEQTGKWDLQMIVAG